MNVIFKVFACFCLGYFNCCECILESNLDTVGEGQRFNECGISKGNSISPLIVGGTGANVGTFPWHAGLYYREGSEQFWQQKCGGSLITDQFILTAAHCVAGVNETNIRVSLGKIFRSWELHEVNEQRRNVSRVSYPNQFERTTFYFDIALLLLNERIKPGGIVMPVCTGILGNHNFLQDKELLIAGWGRTENTMGGSASETLLYNDVMFVPNPICRKYLSPGYSLFDKFCTMKNNSDVSIAQRGDSGGGLTVVHDRRHYIYGLVSVKLTDIKITLFSNLTWTTHLWWMENELRKFYSCFSWSGNIAPDNFSSMESRQRITEKGCELPGFPAHGVYKSVSCSKSETSLACRNMPGVVVPSSWELRYICDRGYSPSKSVNSVCDNGVWRNPNDCIKVRPMEEGFLLVNKGMATVRIPQEPCKSNSGKPIQLNYDQVAIGIAVDCVEGLVYWSDISGQFIKHSTLSGKNITNFITEDISTPEGLAIDWLSRRLYWTDSGKDVIRSADLNTGEVQTLISSGLVNARGIAVHPTHKKVYWSDWNRAAPKLESANLDGTGRETLVTRDVLLPNSLAIDWSSHELCWTDAGTKKIECLSLDSGIRRTVVSNCSYPFGLAITADKYYWTDWQTQKVESAYKPSSAPGESLTVPHGGAGKLYGIAAVADACPRL